MELTIVACPTCGLPAELVDHDRSALAGTRPQQARIRCVMMHLSSVAFDDVAGPGVPEARPTPAVRRRTAEPAAAHRARVVRLRPGRRFPLPDAARYLVVLLFGALMVALLVRAPIMTLPLVPLTLPVFAFARHAWKPLFPKAEPVTLRLPEADLDEPGAEAA